MTEVSLSEPQQRELQCRAKDAWSRIGPRARKATFTWNRRSYVVTHTSFRFVVSDAHGRPVVYWYDND